MRHEVVEEAEMEVVREGVQVRQVFEAIALVSEGGCQLHEKNNLFLLYSCNTLVLNINIKN